MIFKCVRQKRISIRGFVRPSVRPLVRPSVRPSVRRYVRYASAKTELLKIKYFFTFVITYLSLWGLISPQITE